MNSNPLSLRSFVELTGAIQQVHSELTAHASRAVNVSLTLRNWLIGCHIEEYEQCGQASKLLSSRTKLSSWKTPWM